MNVRLQKVGLYTADDWPSKVLPRALQPSNRLRHERRPRGRSFRRNGRIRVPGATISNFRGIGEFRGDKHAEPQELLRELRQFPFLPLPFALALQALRLC